MKIVTVPKSPNYTRYRETRRPVARLLEVLGVQTKMNNAPEWAQAELIALSRLRQQSASVIDTIEAEHRNLEESARNREPNIKKKNTEASKDSAALSRTGGEFISAEDIGGIDLNPLEIDIDVTVDDQGFTMPIPKMPNHIDPAMINGFSPVIMKTFTIKSLPAYLGAIRKVWRPFI